MMLLLGFLVVAGVLAVLPDVVAGPLSFVLVLYVLFRAWPAMRADLRSVRSLRMRPARALRRRAGGAHL